MRMKKRAVYLALMPFVVITLACIMDSCKSPWGKCIFYLLTVFAFIAFVIKINYEDEKEKKDD